MIYDTIIIGAGPAGMTAGIYTGRKEMKTLIIGKDVGGQMAKTAIIENHPGDKITDGVGLAFKIKEQVESFGVEFQTAEISAVKKQETRNKKQGNEFKIITKDNKEYLTKSVILAFGLGRRKLGVADEVKFEGKGLSYCVTCDGPMFKDKPVAVVGASNSGAEAVEFLAKICPKVYWIEVMEEVGADKILADRVSKLDNVEILLSSEIAELIGKDKLEGVRIKSTDSGNDEILKQVQDDKNDGILSVKGVFVEIGYVTWSEWLKDLVELDDKGQIKVNDLCHTNVKGIFAAGDCTNVKYKQIVIAEGQGAVAALEAYEFVQKK